MQSTREANASMINTYGLSSQSSIFTRATVNSNIRSARSFTIDRTNALKNHLANIKNSYARDQQIRNSLRGGLNNIKDILQDKWLPRLITIYFENNAYLGFFETFNYNRDAKTNLVNYDLKFVIVKHYEFNNGEDPNKYVPTTPTVTPAPAPPPPSPKPTYDTYARHGSRWLCDGNQYLDVINPLKEAHQQGKLTQEGEQLLSIVEEFYQGAKGRLGELTTKGEDQHHRIGMRMAQNFPQIFNAKNSRVDARSTVVIRCILSMEAECEELARYFRNLTIRNDVSNTYQWYLAPNTPPFVREAEKGREGLETKWRQELVHPERFSAQIFNDESYSRTNVNCERLMRRVFDVCCNMQSHYDAPNLWSYFTEEEAYDLWTLYNRRHYSEYGASKYTQGKAPFKVQVLLKNFLETADTIVGRKDYHGAFLRL